MNYEVTTWADGYGVWHATVSESFPDPKRIAFAAIAAEINSRQGEPFVDLVIKRRAGAPTGRLHYVETEGA